LITNLANPTRLNIAPQYCNSSAPVVLLRAFRYRLHAGI